VPVEICGKVLTASGGLSQWEMRACSACAGEYEDPDRTAWTALDQVGDGDRDATRVEDGAEEFPAGE
jgi:hypothetical protein